MSAITIERSSIGEKLAGFVRTIGLKRSLEESRPQPVREIQALPIRPEGLKYMPSERAQKDVFVATVLKLRNEGALFDPNNPKS